MILHLCRHMRASGKGRSTGREGSQHMIAAGGAPLLPIPLSLAQAPLAGLPPEASILSHPVTSRFITASAALIEASQLKHILGAGAHGHTLPEMLGSIFAYLSEVNGITLVIGVATAGLLFHVRKHFQAP